MLAKYCGQRTAILSRINRNLIRSSRLMSNEEDGKMTVKILNREQDLGLMIDCYGTYGFRLNNGLTVLGSMAIFPRTILSWQIRTGSEVNEDSLQLFKLLEPKIDLLVFGLDTYERKTRDHIFRISKGMGLNVEIQAVENACSTFNFLCAEGRNVAGAMIPPLIVQTNEDDMLNSALRYNDPYTKKDF